MINPPASVLGVIPPSPDRSSGRRAVTDLTRQNERSVHDTEFSAAWDVSDAPADFIDQQMKAMVGVQLNITQIEAKQKLSQNRSTHDRSGVIGGLAHSNDPQATAMARTMHTDMETT